MASDGNYIIDTKIDSSGEMDDVAAIEGELLMNGYPTFDEVAESEEE